MGPCVVSKLCKRAFGDSMHMNFSYRDCAGLCLGLQWEVPVQGHLVISQNSGTPITTLKYYHPYYGDSQKSTPNCGNPLCPITEPVVCTGAGAALPWPC